MVQLLHCSGAGSLLILWKWSITFTLEGRESLMVDGVTTKKVKGETFAIIFGGKVELVH